jgi:hypothetical protein
MGPWEENARLVSYVEQKTRQRWTEIRDMGDAQAATMEEIALKLWALRTGQDMETATGEDFPATPHIPLTLSKPQTDCRAAN